VNKIEVKSVLNNHKKRDDWFLGDYTLNPYAGCSMGCIYCYTRGSKYAGDHGTNVMAKSNAVPILKKQIKNRIRRNERGIIVLGSAADPYPSVESEINLTREILGIIKRYKFPLHLCTKSTMILRDMDVLKEIREFSILPNDLRDKMDFGVIISFSFSTLNEEIAQILEPGAPRPIKRLETMKKFSEAGFKTGIINMPVLPFISDSDEEIELIVKAAKSYGAHYILSAGLTLFGEAPEDCKTLYYNFLREYYPEILPKYKKIFRGSFAPSNHYQADLANNFVKITRKYGINNRIL
jgi:DNA repair photolyase